MNAMFPSPFKDGIIYGFVSPQTKSDDLPPDDERFFSVIDDTAPGAIGPKSFRRGPLKKLLARSSGAVLSLSTVEKAFTFLDPDFQAKAGPDFRDSLVVVVSVPSRESLWRRALKTLAPNLPTLIASPVQGRA